MLERHVDHGVVFLNNHLPFTPVRLRNRTLHRGNSLLLRKDSRKREEAGLHNRVDPSTHAYFFGYLIGVDDVKLQTFLKDLLLVF